MIIRRNFIVVTQAVADGHGKFVEPHATAHISHDDAVERATRWMAANRAHSMVIYQAVTLVQRTDMPIEILRIHDDGEVVS